jgi:hypothetical protein
MLERTGSSEATSDFAHPTGAELLFQVLTEREERSAIAIASNEPFSGWTKTFTTRDSAPPSWTA